MDSSTHDFLHFPDLSLEIRLASLQDSIETSPGALVRRAGRCVEGALGGSCQLEVDLQSHDFEVHEAVQGSILDGSDFALDAQPFAANRRGS